MFYFLKFTAAFRWMFEKSFIFVYYLDTKLTSGNNQTFSCTIFIFSLLRFFDLYFILFAIYKKCASNPLKD